MEDTAVTIVIGGDIFPKNAHILFVEGNTEKLFAKEIFELFQRADFSICNLEGALTDSDNKVHKCGPSIKAPPETLAGLKKLGINYVTLANNHVIDYGIEGYADTCKALEKYGIGYFGAGKNLHSIKTYEKILIKGKVFIFYGVSETVFNVPDENFPGVNLYDEYRVCNELKKLKESCDYLIVLYHGGVEYFQYPTPWVRKRFHRMADSGADFVIAQHTHCIGAKEDYNGSYLLYGQGNFYFEQRKEGTDSGILLEINFSNEIFEIKHHLVHLNNNMINYDYTPDLTDFLERSQRLANGETFEK